MTLEHFYLHRAFQFVTKLKVFSKNWSSPSPPPSSTSTKWIAILNYPKPATSPSKRTFHSILRSRIFIAVARTSLVSDNTRIHSISASKRVDLMTSLPVITYLQIKTHNLRLKKSPVIMQMHNYMCRTYLIWRSKWSPSTTVERV